MRWSASLPAAVTYYSLPWKQLCFLPGERLRVLSPPPPKKKLTAVNNDNNNNIIIKEQCVCVCIDVCFRWGYTELVHMGACC